MDVSLEQRLAVITIAFLTAYRTSPIVTTPLPLEADLPFRTSFADGDRPTPCVVADCEQVGPHFNRKLLKCHLTVTIESKHQDVTEETERTWMRQLRRLLSNKVLWREFLAGQVDADRAGYAVLRINLGATSSAYDEDTENRYLTTTLTLFVHSDELESTPE